MSLQKEQKLIDLLKEQESVAVAYSGGVDSSYLMKITAETLGSNAYAVTAKGPNYPKREIQRAIDTAAALGVQQIVIDTDITADPAIADNPPDRCYHCKKEIFNRIIDETTRRGIHYVADGSHLDDLGDHRPGLKALEELGIHSPLREVGFTKEEIRERSKALGLNTWDHPSAACLASRIPYGTIITRGVLEQVGRAEEVMLSLGFHHYRVRHHGNLARIEVGRDDIDRFWNRELRLRIIEAFKGLGYQYVTLDLQGYRTGSLNEELD